MAKAIKTAIKIMSVFLSVVLIFEVIPMQAFAAEQPTDKSITQQEETLPAEELENNDEAESASAVILSENVEKREENVKHFRMSDGTMQAAQYADPVHFLKDGVWTDYDNTLTEIDADEEENEGLSLLKNKDLTNQTADYSVRLSKKTNGKKFVRIEKDGYKLSWYYLNAKKSTAQTSQKEDDGDPTTLEKLSSSVMYKDVFKKTNLEYIIGSTGLKENLILESKKAPCEFTAEYKANGLTPVQTDVKTIELCTADGEVIYTINAPFMTDESGAYSDGVTLALSNIKNNTFTVTITLDASWLSDKDRTYPVTVDPAIQTKQKVSEMLSTFVDEKHPNTAHANAQNDAGSMYVGRKINEYGAARTYIKINTLPDIGGIASKVIDARLSICKRNVYSTADNVWVNAYQVTSSWTAVGLTYNNQPSHNGSIVDYMHFAADNKVQSDYHDNYGYTEFKTLEITDLVRSWYENTQSNYGIMLDTEATNTHKVWFFSIQYTTYTEARPVLTVSYRNMSGFEDYWSYTSLSAGRNGSVSVNNFNGNAVFTQPVTMGDGGNLMPVSISLVYNSSGLHYLDANKNFTYMGAKMQTNYHIFLRKKDNANIDEHYKYYLNDSDGTRHWFYFKNTTDTSGKDEDGLNYTLDVIKVGSDTKCSNAAFRITDKDGTKMYFNSSGNIIKIMDSVGNSASVNYETVNNKPRISTITDGAGRKYTFNYAYTGNSNLCTSIKDPAGRITSFSYSDKAMKSVKFPDGKVITLSLNGEILTGVTAIDGTCAKISYDNSGQKRVSQINWGTSSSQLERYSFEYKQNSTKVTDIQNRSYTYQFNNFGQTTGIVSNTDGSAQFFKLHSGNTTDSRANKLLQESRVLQTVTNYAINPGFVNNLTSYSKAIESTTGNPTITVDTTKGYLTRKSLKIVKPATNNGYCSALQTISGLPTGTYTLSCYVNTEGKTISGGGVYVGYKVLDADNKVLEERKAEKISKTDGWQRVSITFNISQGEKARIVLGTEGGAQNACGTMWFDDIQLEKNESAGSCNLIENSALTNGTTGWKDTAALCNITDLPGFTKGVYLDKTKTSPSTKIGLFHRIYTVPGKKGDVFSFGSWVKGDSAPINDLKGSGQKTPVFEIALHFYNSSEIWLKKEVVKLNEDLNTWQFVSGKAIAPVDYDHIGIEIDYAYNVNAVYATGTFCFKEEFGQTYTYDKDGNIVSAVDLQKTNSTFSYYGNQMAKMLNPSGSRYMYSYDSQKKLNYALSSDGQEYGFKYDGKGNVTRSEITARTPASQVEDGREYIIVNAYSGKALDSGNKGNVSDDTFTSPYNPSSVYQRWKLTSTGTDGVYRISPAAFPDKTYLCLDVYNNLADNGTIIQIHEWHGYPAQKFKINGNTDGTFSITSACSSYAKGLDAQYEEKDLDQKQTVKQKAITENDESVKWFFYPVEKSDSRTIVTETSYTDSKNFVKSSKDQRGNETKYTYNEQKGTLTSATDALGRVTNYTYDNNTNSLLSVSSGGMTNSYAYEKDRLKTITVNGGLKYNFQYDSFGRTTSTKVGNGTDWRTLSSMEYGSNGFIFKQTYGNGDYVHYYYDNLDRITGKQYNGKVKRLSMYRYGNDGNLAYTIDSSTNTHTSFTYDLADRLVSQKEYTNIDLNSGTLRSSLDYTYSDKTNYLTGIKHFSPLGEQNISYVRGKPSNGEMPDAVYEIKWNGQTRLRHNYDSLGRVISNSFRTSSGNTAYDRIEYTDVGEGRTSTLVSEYMNNDTIYKYSYDAVGNIVDIFNLYNPSSYEYDSLNQLVRENNKAIGKTYTYSYSNGNITERKEYAYTTGELGEVVDTKVWTYGDSTWRDLLTDFNGTAITYDEIGNPLTIGTKSLTWIGRQLENITDGENTYAYKYNGDGQRVSKTVNGTKTDYYYNGSILAGQKTGNEVLSFMYDENGVYFGFIYNGEDYYFIKNLQNDVEAISDKDENIVVSYTYDAWGNINEISGSKANTLGKLNPIRYRSYYYDSETNLYYLRSRYYSPEMCRFINADAFTQAGQGMLDKNMFAYCENNPVNRSDSNGNSWKDIKQWFSNKWTSIKRMYNKFKKEYIPFAKSFKKSSTVIADAREEFYIASENMINRNSGRPYTMRSQKNKKLNKYLNPNNKHVKKAYAKIYSSFNSGGGELFLEEDGIDMNIEGLSWNELTPQQQQKIVEVFVYWDPVSRFWIGVHYGFSTVEDAAETVVKARFG